MIKAEPKYGERALFQKILQLKKSKNSDDNNSDETTKEKDYDEADKENIDDNIVTSSKKKSKDKKDKNKNAINFELTPRPFNHRFFDRIDSILFKKYIDLSLEKIAKYLDKEDISYINNFFQSTKNQDFFSFLYFSPEPICSLKKDLILHFLIDKPNIKNPYELYQMVKYNYYYCEEFKEVILTKKNNEKVILNKIELKKYLKSNCLISIFQKLLHSLQGKDFSEDEIRRSIDTLLNNNKIYFIRMPNYVSSFTIYDGTIFINRNFFDEASCPYKKEEKEEDKDKNKKGIRGRGKNDKKDGKGKDKKGKDKKGKKDEKKMTKRMEKKMMKIKMKIIKKVKKDDEKKDEEKKDEENKDKDKDDKDKDKDKDKDGKDKEKEKEKTKELNINTEMYDEENKNSEAEDAICGYGALLILIFREIALGLVN